MKGAYRGYFDMPLLSRLRTRIDNPTSELTSQLRTKLNSVIAEVLNENQLAIKSKMIDFVVNELDVQFKNDKFKEQVSSLVSPIFDSYYGSTQSALDAITSSVDAEDEPSADISGTVGSEPEELD